MKAALSVSERHLTLGRRLGRFGFERYEAAGRQRQQHLLEHFLTGLQTRLVHEAFPHEGA